MRLSSSITQRMHPGNWPFIALSAILLLSGTRVSQAQTNLEYWSDVPTDARSVALGEAFVSIAQGSSCIFYNVAGLASQRGVSASVQTRDNYVAPILAATKHHVSVDAMLGTGAWGSVGVRYSSYKITIPDMPLPGGDSLTPPPIGTFEESTSDFEAAYATSASPSMDVGIGVGLVQRTIFTYSGSAPYVSLGLRYHESLLHSSVPDQFAFAFSLDHLGAPLLSGNDAPFALDLTRSLRAGMSWRIAQPDTTALADEFLSGLISGQYKNVLNEAPFEGATGLSNKGYWSLGLELGAWNMIFFRYGLYYRPYNSEYSYADNAQSNIGAGVRLPAHKLFRLDWPVVITVDYALMFLLNHNQEHLISAGISIPHDFFPAPAPPQENAE